MEDAILLVCLDRCNGDYNTAGDWNKTKVCVPNKTEGVNLNVFGMILEVNE